MPLPSVHYGRVTEEKRDWRKLGDKFDAIDDDAELPVTPISVVSMLGFDPLDERDEDDDPVEPEDEEARAQDADGAAVDRRKVHGLDVVIETRRGDVRSGPGFEIELPYDYGYLEGVKGADGDSLDVALGPESNGWAYVIDQRKVDGEGFDEHKVMLGWPSADAALKAYKAGHHKGGEVLMDWTPMPVSEFKQWVKDADLTKPCSPEVKA